MEVPLTTAQPSCFGQHWDPNHVECKGGLDPGYTNPRDKTYRRDKCSWFDACQRVMPRPSTQATSAPVTPQQIIPVNSLLPRPMDAPRPPALTPPYIPARPPTYTPPAPPPQQPPPPGYGGQPAYNQQQQMHHVTPHHVMMVPPQSAQLGPQYVYAPYSQPGSQMPQYLTVPEPVRDDVPWYVRLGHEVLRGLAKSFGHSLAAFFDSNPLRRYK